MRMHSTNLFHTRELFATLVLKGHWFWDFVPSLGTKAFQCVREVLVALALLRTLLKEAAHRTALNG